MMVVHGAQAGGFSPISIYGSITNGVMRDNGLPNAEIIIFLSSLVVNTLLAAALFVLLGGRKLMSLRIDTHQEALVGAAGTGAEAAGEGSGQSGTTAGGSGLDRDRLLTLVAFVVVAVVSLALERNIGFVSITAAVLLTLLNAEQYKNAVKQVAWPTVLLVAGVTTYATVLTEAGSPEFVGRWAAGLGAAALGALVLCYVGGVVSAFASSTALLPVIIPIAIPLIAEGGISAALFVAALGVASTIVDVSPFSTNGALMLANKPDTIDEKVYYKQILGYGVLVVLVGTLLVWAALVLPGW